MAPSAQPLARPIFDRDQKWNMWAGGIGAAPQTTSQSVGGVYGRGGRRCQGCCWCNFVGIFVRRRLSGVGKNAWRRKAFCGLCDTALFDSAWKIGLDTILWLCCMIIYCHYCCVGRHHLTCESFLWSEAEVQKFGSSSHPLRNAAGHVGNTHAWHNLILANKKYFEFKSIENLNALVRSVILSALLGLFGHLLCSWRSLILLRIAVTNGRFYVASMDQCRV